jgi:type IX secretion system PorP/SprF family membrane protein
MMKKLFYFLITTAIICISDNLNAQNDPLFTQYMQNRLIINPAFSGSNIGLDIAAVARFQNIGLSNRLSSTQAIAVSSSVEQLKGGLGLTLSNDMIGLQRTTSLQLSYAYQKRIKEINIGVGVGVGFINMGINGAAIITPDGIYDNSFDHNDPNLSRNIANSFSPDFSAGVYVGNEKFFASAAVNHLYTNQKIKGLSNSFTYNHDRNLIIGGGYNFTISKNFSVQPSLLLRTNFQKVQGDISALFTVYKFFFTGIAFRGYSSESVDAISFFIGGAIKGVKIMYSYDAGISNLRRFNTGSHEITVNYYMPFKINKLEGKYYHNSRYL